MINNIRKLNVFNYEQEEDTPHNRLLGRDQIRHKKITGATIMQLMFRNYPEDTEMLLGMGVPLSVESYTGTSDFRNRWEIIAHVTVNQKRKWDEYKFMQKLAGREREII